ncbi:iron complex transport system substrate-binding protein [Leucobacter exalbidus]|uniref:Iron complex transport system substrate-binding protein n=1 Tax=Leucobacter exalbidus TaxID=662960 RepID=A0A940PT99_9MICO|nr:ABC transporter substrate-binding protein [Leucobacter exalbidus]MBP1327094.1 iron complex transport system substrate-binding protein [Leucobacter exalbidus]
MLSLRKARVRSALAVVLLSSIALTGCQSGAPESANTDAAAQIELPPLSEITPLENPRDYEGETTAVIGGPTLTGFNTVPDPKLPVTVTSHDRAGDVDVEVTDSSRVLALSMSGSLAELVHSLGMGDSLIGRDVSTNFEGAEDLPVVTRSGHAIDAEGVLALNPSLILTDGTIGPNDVVLQLRDAGIPVVTVDRAVDDKTTYETAQQVADALGVGHIADDFNAEIQAAVAAKEAEVAELLPADEADLPRVAFLYVRGTSGIYYLFGEGSGIDSMISSVGAVDVAKEIGWKGERPMTDEALVAIDPDILLVMTQGLESAGGVDGLLAAQPSIALTSAGEKRRIIDVDEKLLFAGGTRLPDVIDGLARAIYAPDSLPTPEK